MNRENQRYISFLLRLWQEKSQGKLVWRASLESPLDGTRLGFLDLDTLLAYLENLTKDDTCGDRDIDEKAG